MAPGRAIFDATSAFGGGANQVFGKLEVHQMKKDGGVSAYGGGPSSETTQAISGDKKYLGSYYFVDAFPISVGEIALDWSTQNQIETFTVNIENQYWYKAPSNKDKDKSLHSDPNESPFQPGKDSIDSASNWATGS